jgi:hypothetical protein
VTLTGVGSCTVTATQSGDSDYLAATNVSRTFNIGKGDQSITFDPLGNHHYGTGPYTLHASASSGLVVTFSAEGGSACSVSGTTVTLTRAGTCTIDADQAGNDDWSAADTVTRSFTVLKAVPVVQLSTADQHPKFGNDKVLVSVLATAPLTPTGSVKISDSVAGTSCTVAHLSASGTGSCTLLLRPGDVEVEAHYSGDSNYKLGRDSEVVHVDKFKPALTLSTSPSSAPGGKHKVNVHVRVHRTASTAPIGTVSVSDGKGESCTIHLSGGEGHCSIVVGNGSFTITAQYNGDTNYAKASATTHIHLS